MPKLEDSKAYNDSRFDSTCSYMVVAVAVGLCSKRAGWHRVQWLRGTGPRLDSVCYCPYLGIDVCVC